MAKQAQPASGIFSLIRGQFGWSRTGMATLEVIEAQRLIEFKVFIIKCYISFQND